MFAPMLLANGDAVPLRDLPVLSTDLFRTAIINSVAEEARIASFFGYENDNGSVRLVAVLARSQEGVLEVLATEPGEAYPSLTPDCPQAHWFEREIAEQWGIRPEGHPWLKPIRYHHSYRAGHDAWARDDKAPIAPCVTDYYRVEGEEAHEVAVGPVHAGIIEPGHFRFQCHGEDVLHLEIALGYQHRGVERAMLGGPHARAMHYMETLAGDTSIGHGTAYCEIIEALSGATASARASAIRGIALELERLANHAGDLGALAGDVGYLPTMSFCGRLRGDFLNMTALICGNRFGRGLVRPGGVAWDLDDARCQELATRLDATFRDVTGAADLLFEAPSVMARFEGVGTVSLRDCTTLGLVGPSARASGSDRDTRTDFPSGIYRFAQVPASSWDTGDVLARALVRWLEIQRSVAYIREHINALPDGPTRTDARAIASEHIAASLVEGWRGEVCHVAITNAKGRFAAYKVVDPSFHNWMGLAMALRGQQISDFPLCNKSFNLSYCGHDL
ncbi:MAG TPA: NADH-quinone oxidoreductase subunit C [Candidatus Hydrogenedentes bacterium]|nr:NADH-quinone oxidoreductase subunit C [Candidatus Hydrogenedentota bacterium]